MIGELIVFVVSIIFLMIGISQWKKGNHLMRHGRKATAIIFENKKDNSGTDGPMYYPVVRFQTDKQEWVTRELSVGYSTPEKVGTKIKIIYDPEDPTSFETNSTFHLEILPRLLVAIGICGLVFGVLEVFDFIEVL
jgi:Protein of unknown function (DUF3592)